MGYCGWRHELCPSSQYMAIGDSLTARIACELSPHILLRKPRAPYGHPYPRRFAAAP
jgi:hypothetical protein